MQMSCDIQKVSLFWHQQTETVLFILFLCTMHCTFHFLFKISINPFLLYWSNLKINAVNQTILLCGHKRLTIYQSKVQPAMAQNKEQYNFHWIPKLYWGGKRYIWYIRYIWQNMAKQFTFHSAEAYLKLCRISKMELLTSFAKSSILDVWQETEYASSQ